MSRLDKLYEGAPTFGLTLHCRWYKSVTIIFLNFEPAIKLKSSMRMALKELSECLD